MYARDVMDSNPTVVHPDDTISKATRFIMENRYRRLPVVEHDGTYLGAFGLHCLLRLSLPKAVIMEKGLENIHFMRETLSDLHHRFHEIEDEPVSLCMHCDVPIIRPDTPLMETMRILYDHRGSLPVVDAQTNKLVGAISYFDVLDKMMEAEI